MNSGRMRNDGNSGITTTHVKQWKNVNEKCKKDVNYPFSSISWYYSWYYVNHAHGIISTPK